MTIDVAVVGLNFGGEFAPIYASHPDVGRVAVVDTDAERARTYAERYGMDAWFSSLDDLLATDEWDAVHITTPVPLHAQHVQQVLRAGRHCACAVPMALSIKDCEAVLTAQRETGLTYMMMETSVYQREFFYAQDLHRSGELGEITFFRGVHIQNLDGFPPYWMGYPPMAYVTHALSPALALAGTTVEKVHCLGSGHLEPSQEGGFGNPFPLETGVFRLRDTDAAAEVTMSFFRTARRYQEGFSVYGTRMGVEWPPYEGDAPITFTLLDLSTVHRGRDVDADRREPPDRTDLLPEPLRPFTLPSTYQPRGGGEGIPLQSHHSGSHPHLVHEFVSAVVQKRNPAVDAVTAANWTVPGLCAHASALAGGEAVAVPRF